YCIVFTCVSVSTVKVVYQSSYGFVCLNNILNINNVRISCLVNISKLSSVVIHISAYIGIAQYFDEFVQNVGIVDNIFKVVDYILSYSNVYVCSFFIYIYILSCAIACSIENRS